MEKPPCTKDCELRNATCHAHCTRYAEYAERREAERTARGKEQQSKTDFCHVRHDRVRAIAVHSLPIEKRKRE